MMKLNTIVKYFLSSILIFFSACIKPCDEALIIGEEVQIPIEFVGFSLNEINGISVCRIDKVSPAQRDSFMMRDILWANEARTNNEIITDRVPTYKVTKKYGDYESYFDNCILIFDWQMGSDTLFDFQIKKSRRQIKGCHKNDPNVQIDKLNFVHVGESISKNQSIRINR